jgi:23S rRNA (uracil1939-C5)-methyltransferase
MDYGGTYGKRYKKIFGKDKIIDYIGEFKFTISPNSFFQTNRDQAYVLYEKAKDYLDLKNTDVILDLYCGIGSISIYIANEVKRVYGVEVAEESIKDARTNARLNKINNIEFTTGKAEETLPFLIERGIEANKVIVDPPRKGCDKKVLDAIVKINPEKIVYVSCNPTTLARDLKILVENGYKVVEVQPIDMFPHTAHIESVTLLEKDK